MAVVGTDIGSSHFVYKSEDFGDGVRDLRCTNRVDVLEWLKELGANRLADASALDLQVPDDLQRNDQEESEREKKKSMQSFEDDNEWKPQSGPKKGKRERETAKPGPGKGGGRKNLKRKLIHEPNAPKRGRKAGTKADKSEAAGDSSEVQSLARWIEIDAQEEDVEKFR